MVQQEITRRGYRRMKGIFTKLREKRLRKKIAKELPNVDFREAAKEKPKTELISIAKPKEEPKEKPVGLGDRVDEINEKLDLITQQKTVERKLKKKTFRLPFRVKSQLKKLALKSKVQVLLLQNNGNIKPTIAEIKNGMLIIGDKLYDGSPTALWFWNGKFPTMIVAEWDLRPVTREYLYHDAVANKRLSDPQTIIIRGMELKEILQGKGMGGKSIIWIIIGGIVIFYILFAGG